MHKAATTQECNPFSKLNHGINLDNYKPHTYTTVCPRWKMWISFFNYGEAKYIFKSTFEATVLHDLSVHFDF